MSGGAVCAVASCNSNSNRERKKENKLSFHSFPRDPELRKQWIKSCYRQDKIDSIKTLKICSKHFTIEDYEDALQARLLNTKPRKLKKDSLPSLHLPINEKVSKKAQSLSYEERQSLINELLESSENQNNLNNSKVIKCNKKEYEYTLDIKSIDCKSLTSQQKIEELEKTNKILQEKIIALEKSHNITTKILREKITELQCSNINEYVTFAKENTNNTEKIDLEEKYYIIEQENNKLKKQLQIKKSKFSASLKQALKESLTPNQIDIILKNKSKVKWTRTEQSIAFTLRYFSKDAYNYLRKTLHYPLPGISTLQRWASILNIRKGALDNVFHIMRLAGQKKTKAFRVAALSFGEIPVSNLYEYCEKNDIVVGPHTHVQVVMCRGLLRKWKQPIYFGFDQKLTTELVCDLLIELHKADYDVAACVTDCSESSEKLWNEFGLNMDKTSIEHPVTKKPVFFFADANNCLILLRNRFIRGITLPNGVEVNSEPMEYLIDNIMLDKYLTLDHINNEITERENVFLAAELFSKKTVDMLKLLQDENLREICEFVDLISKWYDVMSSCTNVPCDNKKPFCMDEGQNKVLEDILYTMRGVKCGGSVLVFQKAIVMSVNSLIALHASVCNGDHARKYLLTVRLNLDCLYNLFAQMKKDIDPQHTLTPLNAIYKFRTLLLSKVSKMPHINIQYPVNIQISTEETPQYLMGSVLKRAKLDLKIPAPFTQNLLEDCIDSENDGTSSVSLQFICADQAEQDGVFYVAGYIAAKFRINYPYLAIEGVDDNIAAENVPNWVEFLTFVGLARPSDEWMRQVLEMDKHFLKLHKNSFFDTVNVLKKTTNFMLKEMSDVPSELVKEFCKKRVLIRIKYLNLKNEEKIAEKRSNCETVGIIGEVEIKRVRKES